MDLVEIVLYVSDMEAAVASYRDVLGLEVLAGTGRRDPRLRAARPDGNLLSLESRHVDAQRTPVPGALPRAARPYSAMVSVRPP